MEQTKAYIPDYLRQIASIDTAADDEEGGSDGVVEVDVQYKICHLFANSIAERTLIAVFHDTR